MITADNCFETDIKLRQIQDVLNVLKMFKALSVLLLIQVQNAQWCLSQDVIRGERDQFQRDVWQNVHGSHSCADDGNCMCGDDDVDDEGYNNKTFIYDINNSSSGRCVKEEHFVKDRTPGIYSYYTFGCIYVTSS